MRQEKVLHCQALGLANAVVASFESQSRTSHYFASCYQNSIFCRLSLIRVSNLQLYSGIPTVAFVYLVGIPT